MILDPYLISGFVWGDGNFYLRVLSSNSKLGYRVELRFIITQHSRDVRLMEKRVEYIESGNVYKYKGKSGVSLSIVDFTNLTIVIIPFFNKNLLIGVKLSYFIVWCKIHSLMVNRFHLRVEGINLIRKIKRGMFMGRSF